MRLTLPQQRQSLVWLLKSEWIRKGTYWDPKPKIPKIYEEQGVDIVDAVKEYTGRKRHDWTPPDPNDPRYNPTPEFRETLRDYHEKPERVFNIYTRLMEGAPQAQILTNTQILPGVPEGVTKLLGKVSVPNQDELCQRYILQANRWDATKVKLPKRFNVHHQMWKFKSETGIPKRKICSTMVSNLTRLCLTAAAMNPGLKDTRKVFRDYFMSNEISYNDVKIRVQALLEAAVASKDPVPAFADDSIVNESCGYQLPDMYPMDPTIQIVPTNVFIDFNSTGFREGKTVNMHTLVFNVTSWYSAGMRAAQAMVFLHSQALLQAKMRFGEGNSLPEPISVQAIQTDGHNFHFTYYQLNTRETKSDIDMANARLGVMLLSRVLWRRSALSASQTACQASLINGHLTNATTFHSAHIPYVKLFSTNVCLCREHTVQPESKTLDNLNEVANSKGNSPNDTPAIPENDLVAEVMPYLTKVITEKSKFKSPSFKYLEGLVKILASFKLKGVEIVDCLSQNHHELNKIGHEVLVDKIGYLRTNGFHPAEVATLLKTRPNVLLMSKERIKESLQAYMGVGVVDGRIQVLLANEPELFDFSTSQIHQRVHDLHKYFSRKEIIEIVGSNPNVFQDSWENIEQKFKYVIQVMGLDVKHLKRFQVFDHSLLHMKIRHKFLYKAGLYQTPDKLGTTEIENPSITRIMDTPDKIFAIQVAGMSVAELEAFKKMEQFEDTLELLEYESSDSEDEHEDRSERTSEHLNLENFSEEELVTLERLAKYRASRL